MKKWISGLLVVMVISLVTGVRAGGEMSKVSRIMGKWQSSKADPDLVAKGKASYDGYGCYDCHGPKGEGSTEGPSLIESKLTEEEIRKTLINPSADARARGMPVVPPDSPDLPGLVAFVVSLRKPATAAAVVSLDVNKKH